MPSNLELKKSLQQAKQDLLIKDKEIAELQSQLSNFLQLDTHSAEIVPQKAEIVPQVKEEIVPQKEEIVPQVKENETKQLKKRRSRSLWNLYLW